MSDRPGCTVAGCTNRAAYKIVYDDRLTDQWWCFTHAADDIIKEGTRPLRNTP